MNRFQLIVASESKHETLQCGIGELDDALLAIMAQLASGVFVDRAADPEAVLAELAKLQKQVTGHQAGGSFLFSLTVHRAARRFTW